MRSLNLWRFAPHWRQFGLNHRRHARSGGHPLVRTACVSGGRLQAASYTGSGQAYWWRSASSGAARHPRRTHAWSYGRA